MANRAHRSSGFRPHCESTQLMDSWRGHFPITSEILLPILERAAAGENEFSRAERILYTACEFWAATAARSIVLHLGSEVVDNLQKASFAFSTIGALHVRDTLNAVLSDLANARTKRRYRECLAALEEDLLKTKDPVDQLIARFAEHLKESCAVRAAWCSPARVISEPDQARDGGVVRQRTTCQWRASRPHGSTRIGVNK